MHLWCTAPSRTTPHKPGALNTASARADGIHRRLYPESAARSVQRSWRQSMVSSGAIKVSAISSLQKVRCWPVISSNAGGRTYGPPRPIFGRDEGRRALNINAPAPDVHVGRGRVYPGCARPRQCRCPHPPRFHTFDYRRKRRGEPTLMKARTDHACEPGRIEIGGKPVRSQAPCRQRGPA